MAKIKCQQNLENYIIRRSLHYIDAAKMELVKEHPNINKVLEHIGRAINDIESRRRLHYVLKPSAEINLSSPHHLLAPDSLGKDIEHADNRVIRAVVSQLKKRLNQHGHHGYI
jgi:dihydroorotate dehydrogenase